MPQAGFESDTSIPQVRSVTALASFPIILLPETETELDWSGSGWVQVEGELL
jgi:hypothetical protein